MQKKKSVMFIYFTCLVTAFLLGYFIQKIQTGLPSLIFKPPTVILNLVEVDYRGWWYFSSKERPTRGKIGNYGAPLLLAFIFDIKNPNSYPITMESLEFTVAFEEFDLKKVSSVENETIWIPPNKTARVRMSALFDVREALLTVLKTGTAKLKKKKISHWGQLETWWITVPDLSFPIYVKDGSAEFKINDKIENIKFQGTYQEQHAN